jgi:hypothetical protein
METCTHTVGNESGKNEVYTAGRKEREIERERVGDRGGKSKREFNNILHSMTRKNPSLMHMSQ